MRKAKSLISILLSCALFFSLCACGNDNKSEEPKTVVFEDHPFFTQTYNSPGGIQAAAEFEHSVYKYYALPDEYIDDYTHDINDHINFVFYYGWEGLEGFIEEESPSIPQTSIYFVVGGEKYFVKTVNKEFYSDDFKYYTYRNSFMSFSHHEHLTIPSEFYLNSEEGSITIAVYYDNNGVEELLTYTGVFFERHGDELWFSNGRTPFPEV